MVRTMATQSEPPEIKGTHHPATAAGFAQLINEANKITEVYRLVTVVRLDKVLAAVYEKRPRKTGDSFFV